MFDIVYRSTRTLLLMRFATEIHMDAMPEMMSDFIAIVGWDAWQKRGQDLSRQFKENQFLGRYFRERHRIELALFSLMAYRRARGRLPNTVRTPDEFQLYSFIATTVQFNRQFPPAARSRLAGRLRDGLKSENALVALYHEMHVAAHFMRSGFNVEPADLLNGGGADFIVTKGEVVAEVECKMASADVGRPIHQRRVAQMNRILHPALEEIAQRMQGGRIVTVQIQGHLTGQAEQHQAITRAVIAALTDNAPALSGHVVAVRADDFDLRASPLDNAAGEEVSEELVQWFHAQRGGDPNAYGIAVGKARQNAIVVALESTHPTRVAKGIYEQLKHAAKDQFSRTRPGVLMVQLADVTPPQLIELQHSQGNEPNALQGIATRLFNDSERNFLHTVAFVSSGGMQHKANGVVTDDGPCYLFKNAKNPYHDDSRYIFF